MIDCVVVMYGLLVAVFKTAILLLLARANFSTISSRRVTFIDIYIIDTVTNTVHKQLEYPLFLHKLGHNTPQISSHISHTITIVLLLEL